MKCPACRKGRLRIKKKGPSGKYDFFTYKERASIKMVCKVCGYEKYIPKKD